MAEDEFPYFQDQVITKPFDNLPPGGFKWILVLVMVLIGAQVNLSALVLLKVGDPSAVVGWRQAAVAVCRGNANAAEWRCAEYAHTILAVTSAILFLMGPGALLHWWVPAHWFPWLVAEGAVLSIPLQIIWFTGWTILPILVDVALLWAIFGQHLTVASLRG